MIKTVGELLENLRDLERDMPVQAEPAGPGVHLILVAGWKGDGTRTVLAIVGPNGRAEMRGDSSGKPSASVVTGTSFSERLEEAALGMRALEWVARQGLWTEDQVREKVAEVLRRLATL